MKSFKGLVLCNYHDERINIHVQADLQNGKLTLAGHDFGKTVEGVWGDSDYEYWYSLDRENTKKLLAVIHGEEDPKAAVLREFSGEGGCKALRDICNQNEIQYEFHSYI